MIRAGQWSPRGCTWCPRVPLYPLYLVRTEREGANYTPEGSTSPDTECAGTLIWYFPAQNYEKLIPLTDKPSNLKHFVVIVLMEQGSVWVPEHVLCECL